ncbi:hypothetical protein HYN59_13025 [Flavobacterium album]|uniref:Uncharacterized protein n=1 Tax=Flavobacterium album TaxID=2175091 RepID=A0A2S1QZX4_9FLAO|nr:hypothetical protein [Flavobacterium album]AWH85972.1 hypothetical protein HYN59_13025 [Flavobacterium album]
MKTIFLFIALALSTVGTAQKIPADKQLYDVNIFRWAKGNEGELTDKIVLINADGSVTFNGEEHFRQLDMNAVTIGFNKFIEGEKIEKLPAYGEDEMTEGYNPEPGEQALHITVVRMQDYLNDKDNYLYPAEYFKLIVIPVSETPTALYKYLSPNVVNPLKDMLED